MSKSLIYHYYGSKDDILFAVMSSHVDQLVADVREINSRDWDAAETLRAMLHAFMTHYVGAADRQKVLLNELHNLTKTRRATIVRKQRFVIDAVQALLVKLHPRLARDAGRARAQTMLLFGTINWTHTWFDAAGPVSPGEIADMAFAMVQAS